MRIAQRRAPACRLDAADVSDRTRQKSFDAVGFSTRLTVNSGSTTTSGTTDFSTALPSFRRYVTAYTLTCRKV